LDVASNFFLLCLVGLFDVVGDSTVTFLRGLDLGEVGLILVVGLGYVVRRIFS
jgi:hypothetical protein